MNKNMKKFFQVILRIFCITICLTDILITYLLFLQAALYFKSEIFPVSIVLWFGKSFPYLVVSLITIITYIYAIYIGYLCVNVAYKKICFIFYAMLFLKSFVLYLIYRYLCG